MNEPAEHALQIRHRGELEVLVGGLEKWHKLAGEIAGEPVLIYGGSDSYRQSGVKVVGWRETALPF